MNGNWDQPGLESSATPIRPARSEKNAEQLIGHQLEGSTEPPKRPPRRQKRQKQADEAIDSPLIILLSTQELSLPPTPMEEPPPTISTSMILQPLSPRFIRRSLPYQPLPESVWPSYVRIYRIPSERIPMEQKTPAVMNNLISDISQLKIEDSYFAENSNQNHQEDSLPDISILRVESSDEAAEPEGVISPPSIEPFEKKRSRSSDENDDETKNLNKRLKIAVRSSARIRNQSNSTPPLIAAPSILKKSDSTLSLRSSARIRNQSAQSPEPFAVRSPSTTDESVTTVRRGSR